LYAAGSAFTSSFSPMPQPVSKRAEEIPITTKVFFIYEAYSRPEVRQDVQPKSIDHFLSQV
jgi:hypothetical protein